MVVLNVIISAIANSRDYRLQSVYKQQAKGADGQILNLHCPAMSICHAVCIWEEFTSRTYHLLSQRAAKTGFQSLSHICLNYVQQHKLTKAT